MLVCSFDVRRELRLVICELHHRFAIAIGVDASSRIVGLDPEHELERVHCVLRLSEEETIRRIGTAVRVECLCVACCHTLFWHRAW